MIIPFLNRFTCSRRQLPFMIHNLKKKNWNVILDYTNENKKNHKNNFKELTNLIKNYPKQNFAIKLSSLNIDNRILMEKYITELVENAIKNKSKIYIDAEHCEIQDKINQVSNELMKEYNKNEVNVYKTYQMYRKDSFCNLQKDLLMERNYCLGVKLVRGAYYNEDAKYNLLHELIGDTHMYYDEAIKFFVENYKKNDKLLCATHNESSIVLAKYLIDQNKLKNIEFSQLLGMSDDISIKLAKNYKVYKYLPYGKFKDTIPYLTRRLYENYPMIMYLLR